MVMLRPIVGVAPWPRHLIIVAFESLGSRFEGIRRRRGFQYTDQTVEAFFEDFMLCEIAGQVVGAWTRLLYWFLFATHHRRVERGRDLGFLRGAMI